MTADRHVFTLKTVLLQWATARRRQDTDCVASRVTNMSEMAALCCHSGAGVGLGPSEWNLSRVLPDRPGSSTLFPLCFPGSLKQYQCDLLLMAPVCHLHNMTSSLLNLY